jgi:hypothetical protein
VLDNSYPTDFDSAEHFTQGIMKEVFDYMLEEEQVETAVSMLEFIKEYFDSINIKGEIIEHEFRTCKCHMGKWKKYSFFILDGTEHMLYKNVMAKVIMYLFLMQMILIIGELALKNLTADCYNLRIGKHFTYQRPLIFKNSPALNWHYEDALHEYATCDKQNFFNNSRYFLLHSLIIHLILYKH